MDRFTYFHWEMRVRKILYSLFLSMLLGKAYAQDPHYSQFFSSPLTLNPAFTGKFSGTYRLAGNYRNQWPSINNAFTTSTFSADVHLLQDQIPNNDTWGIGLAGYSDNSSNGALNSITRPYQPLTIRALMKKVFTSWVPVSRLPMPIC